MLKQEEVTLDCKYCAHKDNYTITFDEDYPSMEEIIEYDYEVPCKGCGSLLRVNECLPERETEIGIDDVDREELARLIKEGYTSGRIDNGEGKHISWVLTVTAWKD